SYEFLSTQRNKNDIFVCRKCNKIFTDLSQYVEHKVKEENFSIGKTRSKSDHRVILPRLVQKRNRKASQLESKSKKLKIDNEKPSDESESQHISAPEAKDCTSVSSGNTLFKSISNMYACKQCNKTFRREAALQRHLKYDHKNEDLEQELDASESELYRDDSDEEYSLEPKEKPGNDGTKETEEILIVIGNPHTSAIKPAEKDSRNENELEKVEEAASDFSDKGSKSDIKTRRSRGEVIKDVQKYTCNVCGRGFNEQSVFKAHALVHSEQRKYVCTVKSCPYAFKTKGGLVRHMRRHTGDRPYNCDRCGRSFSESGSLTRHLKARRNCAALPDKAYPRYMKSWTYHPNIPAVVDPALRDPERGRSTLGPVTIPATGSFTEEDGEEVHYIITELFDDASALSAATVITVDALDVPTSISPTVALDGCYSVTMENSGDVNLLEKSNETVTDDENKSAKVSKDNRTPERELFSAVSASSLRAFVLLLPPMESLLRRPKAEEPTNPLVPISTGITLAL
ncbi:transcription factor e4f1-like, partial [Plakobranchus ocellatus]